MVKHYSCRKRGVILSRLITETNILDSLNLFAIKKLLNTCEKIGYCEIATSYHRLNTTWISNLY